MIGGKKGRLKEYATIEENKEVSKERTKVRIKAKAEFFKKLIEDKSSQLDMINLCETSILPKDYLELVLKLINNLPSDNKK